MFRIDGHWLTDGEREEVIGRLFNGRLFTCDNNRKLPLKMGGFTDIYANLRLMRSSPYLIRFLAELYSNPLRRLRPNRFIEVPEAMSLLAGALSVETGIPAVTIREEAKPGRVVKGQLIGDLNPGETVVIIDDVITNGVSKLQALSMLRDMGVKVLAIVVLVDRQQGWKKKLAEAGFGDVPVWSAMTLHHVRKYLVENGLMKRCDPIKEEKNPIIVALDGKDWEDILPLLDQLRTSGCILKVNDLLWNEGIKRLLPDLSVYGRVMADIKGHDIKNTLENISRHFSACPPWAITVHASGGAEMIRATRNKLNEVGAIATKVLAVTVLTSLKDACAEVYTRQPLEQVLRLAEIANNAGADGFVCSPEEVRELSTRYPNMLYVTPGVRSPGVDQGDQQRVDTPKNAKDNGATNLVMGRQILGAKDPVAEVERVNKEELGIEI